MTLQQDIIVALQTRATIDANKEIQRRKELLKQYLLDSGQSSYVLGISGGVDSSTAGRLAQLACEELNTDHETDRFRFYAMRLPYQTQLDEDDAQAALAFVKPHQVITYNIGEPVDAAMTQLSASMDTDGFVPAHMDFAKGNVKARLRMVAQYAVGNLVQGLIIGTDHSAEAITGFFTKHGDGACDIAPLFGLNKRQVRLLSQTLGAPENIYTKVPTADLDDLNPQRSDEDALGITYDHIDDYLEGKSVPDSARESIEAQYLKTEHKRLGVVTLPPEQ